MLTALKILSLTIVFVGTAGAVFPEWGRKYRVLALSAAIVAIVGSLYLFRDVWMDLRRFRAAYNDACHKIKATVPAVGPLCGTSIVIVQETSPDHKTDPLSCDLAYSKARMDDNPYEAWGQFLIKCPNHPGEKDARELRDKIGDSRNWQKCFSKKDLETCDYYLNAHPNGRYRKQAEKIILAILQRLGPETGSVSPAALQKPSTDDVPSPSAGFREYANRDMDGGDYRKMPKVTKAECVAACLGASRCQAYSYDSWNQWCFLKEKTGGLRLEPSSITGVRSNISQPSQSAQPQIMQRYRGRHFPGKGYRSDQASSFELCESQCEGDSQCAAFTFYNGERRCKLFASTGEYFSHRAADSGVKRQLAEPAGPSAGAKTAELFLKEPGGGAAPIRVAVPAPDSRAFRMHDNRDIQGGDYSMVEGLGHDACKSRCNADSQCQAYTYNKWNRKCFLKDRIGSSRLEPASITGVRQDVSQPSRSVKPFKMERYRGKAFPYRGQTPRQAASFEACEQRCRDTAACVAFTYFKSSRQCRLMESTGEYFADKRADSGVKRQSPE